MSAWAGGETGGELAVSSSRSVAESAAPTVLVPTGSTEQHGAHLPLATDTIIASAVAGAVSERLNSSRATGPDAAPLVFVAPAVPYGASGEHQSFAGTISIGHEALQVVLIELVRSLSTWAGRIVFVNGHGGNVPSLAVAVTQLIGEGHAVSWVSCAVPHAAGMVHPASDSHAGRTETSLLLHLSPESVDMTQAERGNTSSLPHLLASMREGGVAAVSPNGVLGNPTAATAAEGAALFAAIVDDVCARIADGSVDARGRLVGQPSPVPVAAPAAVPAAVPAAGSTR